MILLIQTPPEASQVKPFLSENSDFSELSSRPRSWLVQAATCARDTRVDRRRFGELLMLESL